MTTTNHFHARGGRWARAVRRTALRQLQRGWTVQAALAHAQGRAERDGVPVSVAELAVDEARGALSRRGAA